MAPRSSTSTSVESTDARRRLGAAGEQRAVDWYVERGYEVLARNWRCRNGEIDVVLRRGDTIVFCEVKTRRSTRFGHPAEAVTAPKQHRIRQLASAWLRSTDCHAPVIRFDVAAVQNSGVDVIEDAF